jgi:putative sterol carrier protein
MGLVGLMNTVKIEGAKHNIKVNTIAPLAASRLTEDIMSPEMFARMQPDYIAGMVLYLCSDDCSLNGEIFNAAAGYCNRAAILTGPGAVLGDGATIPTVEDIRDNWESINSMENAREIPDAASAITSFLMPPAPGREAPGASGAKADVIGVFAKMPEAFDPAAAAGKEVVFQFLISGAGGGEWVVSIKDGTCRIETGRTEKPTTTIIMADEDFIRLVSGELDGMKAYTSGKLKVEGDLMKSQLIGRLFKFNK